MKNKLKANFKKIVVFAALFSLILQLFTPLMKAEATGSYQIGKTTDGDI
ncbi:TPA: hypothetical protein IQB06_002739, partial [Listeria monocytogenes]|nr:hypothetical protein [Listeria monocytogenes]